MPRTLEKLVGTSKPYILIVFMSSQEHFRFLATKHCTSKPMQSLNDISSVLSFQSSFSLDVKLWSKMFLVAFYTLSIFRDELSKAQYLCTSFGWITCGQFYRVPTCSVQWCSTVKFGVNSSSIINYNKFHQRKMGMGQN